MLKTLNPWLGALAALALCWDGASAQAGRGGRQVTVDDIVALEAFGRAAISPDGRWAVYEKRGPYDTAPRFDLASRNSWTIMQLWLADLGDPGEPPSRLLPEAGEGLQRIAWSPDSRRLLISRLQGENFEFGLVDLADRSVRWTGLTPETPRGGATAEWANPDQVLLSIRPDRSLPALLRYDSGTQVRMAENWRVSAAGQTASRDVVEAADGVVRTEEERPPGALVLLDAATGEHRTVMEGQISDFALSPDGGAVAVVTGEEAAPVTSGPIVQQENNERQRLSLVALEDGRVTRPLPGHDLGPEFLRWSPDSSAVLVWAREDGATWEAGGLYAVGFGAVTRSQLGELTPGDARQVVAGVRADWIGRVPVLFARRAGESRYDWYLLPPGEPPQNLTAALTAPQNRFAGAGPSALRLFADGRLWWLDERGARPLTPADLVLQPAWPGDAEQVRRLASNEAPRRGWTAATAASGQSLVVSERGARRRLATGRWVAPRILAVSADAALVLERTGMEEVLWLRDRAGSHRLDAVNTDRRNVVLIEPVPVTRLDLEGRTVTDWLYLPADRPPEQVRGVIVSVYPGRSDRYVWHDSLTTTYGIRPTVLAAAGFAVLQSTMLVQAPPAERGDLYAREIDLSVDAALSASPGLPPNRIAILGHSFGGYAAMEIATHSTRYRSYIASAGIYDMMGYWGEVHPPTRAQPEDVMLYRFTQGWVEAGQAGLGAPPWAAAEAYLASSPYLRAERVTAPVLLLTADLDFVPMTQAERMFSALYRSGKQARMVTYWGEHHHAWSPANIRDRYQEIFDWLDRTLAPAAEVTPGETGGPPSS